VAGGLLGEVFVELHEDGRDARVLAHGRLLLAQRPRCRRRDGGEGGVAELGPDLGAQKVHIDSEPSALVPVRGEPDVVHDLGRAGRAEALQPGGTDRSLGAEELLRRVNVLRVAEHAVQLNARQAYRCAQGINDALWLRCL
jgi:hypothetical protein